MLSCEEQVSRDHGANDGTTMQIPPIMAHRCRLASRGGAAAATRASSGESDHSAPRPGDGRADQGCTGRRICDACATRSIKHIYRCRGCHDSQFARSSSPSEQGSCLPQRQRRTQRRRPAAPSASSSASSSRSASAPPRPMRVVLVCLSELNANVMFEFGRVSQRVDWNHRSVHVHATGCSRPVHVQATAN